MEYSNATGIKLSLENTLKFGFIPFLHPMIISNEGKNTTPHSRHLFFTINIVYNESLYMTSLGNKSILGQGPL